MKDKLVGIVGAALVALSVCLIFHEAHAASPTLIVWGFCGQVGGAHEITTKTLCASRRPGQGTEDQHTVVLTFYKTQWQDGLYVSGRGDEWKARLVSRGRSLQAEDLRIGQQVKADRDRGEIEILNYVAPTKGLRLLLSIKGLEKPEDQTGAVLRTSLSWLLPADTSFRAPSARIATIGDLTASFTVVEEGTQWTYRSRKLAEVLKLNTQLLAPGVTTWDNAQTAGGMEPGLTSRITDVSYSSPFTALPPFKIKE